MEVTGCRILPSARKSPKHHVAGMAHKIEALPESDIRHLDSEQVIANPQALVKELVDNAIDARATSVDVLLSTDAVSKIEVRDNGTGINSDDYSKLGRTGHTSKIQTFAQLASFSGDSLGFRGQALAAAANLANVTITTKTIDEITATEILLNNTGGVKSKKTVNGPVGTTVIVTDIFKSRPVRANVFKKEVSKSISAIKAFLLRTAMARPEIKLSLRVFQKPVATWNYPPNKSNNFKSTIATLFTCELANECIEKTLSISMDDIAESKIPEQTSSLDDGHHNAKFTFEASMVKPNADFPKCANKGFYVSVDSRPLSPFKGTMHKIVKLYRDTINKVFNTDTNTLREPFLRLNIKCPTGSYDPNVEPSKEDVIFSHETDVISLFSRLCSDVYGDDVFQKVLDGKKLTHHDLKRVSHTTATVEQLQGDIGRIIEPSMTLSDGSKPMISTAGGVGIGIGSKATEIQQEEAKGNEPLGQLQERRKYQQTDIDQPIGSPSSQSNHSDPSENLGAMNSKNNEYVGLDSIRRSESIGSTANNPVNPPASSHDHDLDDICQTSAKGSNATSIMLNSQVRGSIQLPIGKFFSKKHEAYNRGKSPSLVQGEEDAIFASTSSPDNISSEHAQFGDNEPNHSNSNGQDKPQQGSHEGAGAGVPTTRGQRDTCATPVISEGTRPSPPSIYITPIRVDNEGARLRPLRPTRGVPGGPFRSPITITTPYSNMPGTPVKYPFNSPEVHQPTGQRLTLSNPGLHTPPPSTHRPGRHMLAQPPFQAASEVLQTQLSTSSTAVCGRMVRRDEHTPLINADQEKDNPFGRPNIRGQDATTTRRGGVRIQGARLQHHRNHQSPARSITPKESPPALFKRPQPRKHRAALDRQARIGRDGLIEKTRMPCKPREHQIPENVPVTRSQIMQANQRRMSSVSASAAGADPFATPTKHPAKIVPTALDPVSRIPRQTLQQIEAPYVLPQAGSDEGPVKSILSTDDPRGYFIRQRRSEIANPRAAKKIIQDKLPMESNSKSADAATLNYRTTFNTTIPGCSQEQDGIGDNHVAIMFEESTHGVNYTKEATEERELYLTRMECDALQGRFEELMGGRTLLDGFRTGESR